MKPETKHKQTTVPEGKRRTVHRVQRKYARKKQSVYTELDYFSSKVESLQEALQRKWLELVNLGLASGYKTGKELEFVYILPFDVNIPSKRNEKQKQNQKTTNNKKPVTELTQSSPKIFMYFT